MKSDSTNIMPIMPNSLEIEKAVLGALLIDDSAIVEIAELITPDVFYDNSHKEIYKAIEHLNGQNKSIDLLTVSQELKRVKKLELIGGDYYLIGLTQKMTSSAHIESHVYILIQEFIRRCLISNSQAVIKDCYDENKDVHDLLSDSYNHLNNVSEASVKNRETNFSGLIERQLEKAYGIFKGNVPSGIKTPITKLTKRTGGWRNSELIIIAARPGMGKTAFALSLALTTAKTNTPVAFFSLEMSKEQLTNRLISMEAKVDNQKFTVHGLSHSDLNQIQPVKENLKTLPMIIDDTASMKIEQLQIKAKRMKSKYGIGLIVVDYLQLISGNSSNREQEVSKISRGLKMIAKNLDIPVIALSQLSRGVENRGGSKRPMLSDLRESGAIEQDADVVMFLYRPEYYRIDKWESDYNNEPTDGECEYIVAKNRNGSLIRSRMRFQGEFTLFSDLDTPYVEYQKETTPEVLNNNEDDMPF